jgi:hypothetical protein
VQRRRPNSVTRRAVAAGCVVAAIDGVTRSRKFELGQSGPSEPSTEEEGSMRANRYLVTAVGCALGVGGAVVSTHGRVWANRCPETGEGYELKGSNSQWSWVGHASSSHTPNDHGNNAHTGVTQFSATAYKAAGHQMFYSGGCGGGEPDEPFQIWANDASFKVTLATPFFNGKKALQASPASLGTNGGTTYYRATVEMKQGWGALELLNSGGNFRIECGAGMAVRNDPYHDVDTGGRTSTWQRLKDWLFGCAQMQGPFDGCGALCLEDTRGGDPKYQLEGEDEVVLDEDGCPLLDLDGNGAMQWNALPQVTTRLTSTVTSNGDGTITYLYVIENLTENAIPFSVAQVPVSSIENGWSGTVAGNSSMQTSLTIGSGDEDLCTENACMELMVDGSPEVNESMGGQIYVPANRLEFTGTCVISSITASPLPAQNHVTILLAGGSAEDIYLYRETPTGAVCVGEMHGNYVADQSYTIESEDAPPGPVTYYVSVGTGVNKYNSESAETINE